MLTLNYYQVPDQSTSPQQLETTYHSDHHHHLGGATDLVISPSSLPAAASQTPARPSQKRKRKLPLTAFIKQSAKLAHSPYLPPPLTDNESDSDHEVDEGAADETNAGVSGLQDHHLPGPQVREGLVTGGADTEAKPVDGGVSPPLKPVLTAAEKKANRKNNATKMPPPNPHNRVFTDDNGDMLDPSSVAYLLRYASNHKVTPETIKKYKMEWNRLLAWLYQNLPNGNVVAGKLLSSQLPPTEVSRLLSVYLNDRINLKLYRETGEVQSLDTTTLDRLWYGLSFMFRKETTYRITTDPEFSLARETKASNMRSSKREQGLGQLNNQAASLSKAQLIWMLSSDQLTFNTPMGLVWLFWLTLMMYFLPRVRSEASNICRGDFVRIRDCHGSVIGVMYVPQGTLKRDRGDLTAFDAAGYHKRPFALNTDVDKSNFHLILLEMEKHLDLLPHSGNRKTQKVFKMVRSGVPAPGNSFFLAGDLGVNKYDDMLRSMIHATGLKVEKLQLQNQAIRTSVFALHRQLGIAPEDTQAAAGHKSVKTQITYKRGDSDWSGKVTGKVQVCTH